MTDDKKPIILVKEPAQLQEKQVPPDLHKAVIPSAKLMENLYRYEFSKNSKEVLGWVDKTTDPNHREISFIGKGILIRGGNEPVAVKAYFQKSSYGWANTRITTQRMWVSEGKYKEVLPKVIFDEDIGKWNIELDGETVASAKMTDGKLHRLG